jgi:hypothetical protein
MFKVLLAFLAVVFVIALGVAISGLSVWIICWLLHQIIPAIPILTFAQSVVIGVALSILGSFFK